MTNGKRWGLLLGLGLVLAGPLAAQISESYFPPHSDLPAAPRDHVLDQAELFSRDPERLKEISQRLLALQEVHDLPVYVAVYTGLMRENVTDRSKSLYDGWVGEGRDGVVVVCDTDSGQLDLALPVTTYHDLDRGVHRLTRLPEYRMIPILAEIRNEVGQIEDRVEYIDRLTEVLSARLDTLLAADSEATGASSSIKFAAITLAVGLVVALLGFLGVRFLHTADEKARERFYFPDVLVGSRLGAPFCGGRQSVVEFSKPEPPEK